MTLEFEIYPVWPKFSLSFLFKTAIFLLQASRCSINYGTNIHSRLPFDMVLAVAILCVQLSVADRNRLGRTIKRRRGEVACQGSIVSLQPIFFFVFSPLHNSFIFKCGNVVMWQSPFARRPQAVVHVGMCFPAHALNMRGNMLTANKIRGLTSHCAN